MYHLYSLALSLLFVVLSPYFLYQAVRNGKYAKNFKERMGWLPESTRPGAGPVIWVHTVSVGEFNAARPLIDKLKRELPDHQIAVSTTTVTGQTLARATVGAFASIFYFPFDWRFSVRRALRHIRPDAVVILETELWPNFLRECRRNGVKTVVVNGRISPRSFSRYSRAGRFIRRVLQDVSLFIMQSEADAERARQLGAPPGRVVVCGNLKYDIVSKRQGPEPGNAKEAKAQAPAATTHSVSFTAPREAGRLPLSDLLPAPSAAAPLIVAGSTAPGEERMVLDSFRKVKSHDGLAGARLLIAPRHPERFSEVGALIVQSGFTFVRRSEARLHTSAAGADVVLLDSIGELASVYQYASIVLVGGSLVPKGGHNVIEPAAYGKPIIVGPYTDNFRQIIADFTAAQALIQIEANADTEHLTRQLAHEFIRLLTSAETAQGIGERAQGIVIRHQGATDCASAAINQLLGETWGGG